MSEDYPMLAIRAKGFNDEGNDWRLRKILEIAARHPIVNFSDDKTGSKFTASLEEILNSDKTDLGISVVASGLFEEIFQCGRPRYWKP